jgi:hypothetical protein
VTDTRNYLVKVNGGYTYYNGKPVAYSREAALELAGGNEELIEVVPDDMVVVLHDSARKLPRSNDVGAQLHGFSVRHH